MSEPRAEHTVTDVEHDQGVAPFQHGLGGPVEVTAYGPDGERVGYLMANPITDDEVEVVLVPGGDYARLVAVPAPEEPEGE